MVVHTALSCRAWQRLDLKGAEPRLLANCPGCWLTLLRSQPESIAVILRDIGQSLLQCHKGRTAMWRHFFAELIATVIALVIALLWELFWPTGRSVPGETRRQAHIHLKHGVELLSNGHIHAAEIHFGAALRLLPDVVKLLSEEEQWKLQAQIIWHGGGRNANLVLKQLDRLQEERSSADRVGSDTA